MKKNIFFIWTNGGQPNKLSVQIMAIVILEILVDSVCYEKNIFYATIKLFICHKDKMLST